MAPNPRKRPPKRGGMIGRAIEEVETRTGYTVDRSERVELLEAAYDELRSVNRELDLLGWQVMDDLSGQPQELTTQARRKYSAQARQIWMTDPQAGAAVDLMNDFVFGRGVPRPRAKDDEVQELLDEAWDDPDNQLVLTSYAAQVALGTDLSLQSNLFVLMFDDGKDGKIKLGILNHDSVENVVRDPDNRLRALYYLAKEHKQEWDFEADMPKMVDLNSVSAKPFYYREWRNLDTLEAEGAKNIPKPPSDKQGDGKVYHVSINRGAEQIFGIPTMRRLARWFNAYNDYMRARVDTVQAAAAFIMKRKVRGSPQQLAKIAAKAVNRSSDLAGFDDFGVSGTVGLPSAPARPGSIMNENDSVNHEPFTIPTNAGNAMQDGQMLRSQISAATRWPQHYLGDAGSANLATATAMELPVLKAVESRQEVFEGIFRWFLDRVIEKAVDDGRLDPNVDPNADAELARNRDRAEDQSYRGGGLDETLEEYEDQGQDESETERDLTYEFSMPSPLRRMMVDLINSVSTIAKTFDPNGTNMELSRSLLTVALGEGLEMQEPAEAVKDIYPPGYVDPAVAAAMAPPAAPEAPPGAAGENQVLPTADGEQPPGGAEQVGTQPTDMAGNPYSAPGGDQSYQDNGGSIQQSISEGAVTRDRSGEPIIWPTRKTIVEHRYAGPGTPDTMRARTQAAKSESDVAFEDVERDAAAALERLALQPNGNGSKKT